MVEQCGFDPIEETVYRTLVDHPGLSVTELATAVRITADDAEPLLRRLRSAGLVTQLPGQPARYRAVESDLSLAPLIALTHWRLEQARVAANRLAEQFSAARSDQQPLDVIEVVAGATTRADRLAGLLGLARREIRSMDRSTTAAAGDLAPAPRSAGVRVRAIVDRGALNAPGVLDEILARSAPRDRQARLIAQAPFRLRVADDRLAMVLLDGNGPAADEVLVIHPSPLLSGVIDLFETLWRYAVPLDLRSPANGRDPDGPSPEEAQLLPLMAAGMTDEAAARHLGLSLRTLQRQVHGLMNRLGAQTRFQAGLQAKNRGWL